MTLHPNYSATLPCESLACTVRSEPITSCTAQSCPHRWHRQSAEDRERRRQLDEQEATDPVILVGMRLAVQHRVQEQLCEQIVNDIRDRRRQWGG